jgi:AbiJ N-terminal domain 4
MLTDIFARRYEQPRMWETFYEEQRRLLVQGFQLLNDVCPYYVRGKEFWTRIHDLLARELGLTELFPQYRQGAQLTMAQRCETWMLETFNGKISADRFIKERLSLVEIGFREHENFVAGLNAQLAERIKAAELFDQLPKHRGRQIFSNTAGTIRAANASLNAKFQGAVNELNARFRQANCQLHYHNGFIQISEDPTVAQEIETPFFGSWWRSRSGTTSTTI